MICVKQLDKTTVDVFTGNGWENWTRFTLGVNVPKKVKGQNLSSEDYDELKQLLYPNRSQ